MNQRRSLHAPFTSFLIFSVLLQSTAFGYFYANRWGQTAISGSGLQQGDPTTITWGFVPDGTLQTGNQFNGGSRPSELVSFMDTIIGPGPGGDDLTQRPWFAPFEQSFGRWEQVSGLTYLYEPNDDGVNFASQQGHASRGCRRSSGCTNRRIVRRWWLERVGVQFLSRQRRHDARHG